MIISFYHCGHNSIYGYIPEGKLKVGYTVEQYENMNNHKI